MSSKNPNKIIFGYGLGGFMGQFMLLAEALRERGVRSSVTSFRGHDGKVDPRLRFRSIGGFASEIEREAAKHEDDFGSIVLVGHSLGAAASLVAASRHPDRYAATVLIAPSMMGPVSRGATVAMLSRPRWYLPMNLLLKPFLVHRDELKKFFFNGNADHPWIARMAAQPGSSLAVLQSMTCRLAAPAVPTTVVSAFGDRLFSPGRQHAWAARHGAEYTQAEGSHMSCLANPGLANLLERIAKK